MQYVDGHESKPRPSGVKVFRQRAGSKTTHINVYPEDFFLCGVKMDIHGPTVDLRDVGKHTPCVTCLLNALNEGILVFSD